MTKRTTKPPATTLPATILEAEAREFARDLVRNSCEPAQDSGFSAFDPSASHWWVRRLIKADIERNPREAAQIVEYAVHGSTVANHALQELIDEKINRNEPLGAVLGAYAIRAMHPDIHHHHGGKSKVDYLMMDALIVTMIWLLVDRFPSLKATRSQSGWKRQPSACSILTEAMTEAGWHRGGEGAIQAIWRRLAPFLVMPAIVSGQGTREYVFDIHLARRLDDLVRDHRRKPKRG
jgi:hypothetical protein